MIGFPIVRARHWFLSPASSLVGSSIVHLCSFHPGNSNPSGCASWRFSYWSCAYALEVEMCIALFYLVLGPFFFQAPKDLSLCNKLKVFNPYIIHIYYLRYFKLWLFDISGFKVWNIKGLWYFVGKIQGL